MYSLITNASRSWRDCYRQKVKTMVSIDEFKKVDLRVGKILECVRVEGSPKLLKMQVDFGEINSGGLGRRQILAGIGKKYEPEFLIGKMAAFVVNLEPRVLVGEESQGMTLVASSGDSLAILSPDKEVASGSKIT